MIPDAIRRYPWWSSTGRALCCAVLLAAASPFIAASYVHAQAADIDWRSALILHFDPAASAPAADPKDTYLSHIADGLESGWIAETEAGVIAIGPIFARGQDSKIDYPNIDPSLGTAEEWMRLMSAARSGDFAVAVRLAGPLSPEDCSKLAGWAAEADVRHFIVGGRSDLSSLRAALDARASGTSWIAGVSDGNRGVFDADGGALGAGSAETGDTTAARPDAARSYAAPFDAIIQSISIDDAGANASLGEFYRGFARHSASAPQPLVAAVALSPEADHLSTARALMLPGALQVTATSIPPNSSELWRRITAFRARHPAVSRGEHVDLVTNSLAFARTATESGLNDRVVVVLGASGSTTLNVSRIFPDNAMLVDALTGRTAFVSFGMATFEAGPSGVILVEETY